MAALPLQIGDREMFHVNAFHGHAYASYLGQNAENLQWVTSSYCSRDYLPGAPNENDELREAWINNDVEEFKRIAKRLYVGNPDQRNAAVKAQAYQFLQMRKGDIVLVREPAPSKKYVLGVFPSDPWEDGAMLRRTFVGLGVDAHM